MTFGRLQDEPAEYTKRRDELREAEIALRDECERVAELRRMLPLDHRIEDQDFAAVSDGKSVPVRLSELFKDPDKPLVLMQFMYGKAQTTPCPMCTMWADGYHGVVPHLEQRINFAVLVAGDPVSFDAYRRERGWRNLRVVSAANSDLKRRLGFEGEDGSQLPGVSVFVRRPDGMLVHAYSQCALFGEVGGRGMDLLSPVWNFFDLTPSGRGEFMPSTSYAA